MRPEASKDRPRRERQQRRCGTDADGAVEGQRRRFEVPRNAFRQKPHASQVQQRERQAVQELDRDEEVRAIVITGAGDKAFCAGADLKERRGVPASEAGPYINAISTATRL